MNRNERAFVFTAQSLNTSVFITPLWAPITCGKQSVAFTNKKRSPISSEVCLYGCKWKWACPPNYPAVVSHDNYKTQRSPRSPSAALKGIRLDLKRKAATENVSTITKEKWFIWERHWGATSVPVRGSGAGRSQQICLKPARGGGVAVSEAIEQQHENLDVWGVFLKLKVILRQPLSVFHCLSRTPPRSITFGKAPSVVKMFDRAFI